MAAGQQMRAFRFQFEGRTQRTEKSEIRRQSTSESPHSIWKDFLLTDLNLIGFCVQVFRNKSPSTGHLIRRLSSSTKARKPSIKRLIGLAFAQDAVSWGFIGTQRRIEAALFNLMTQALSNMFSDTIKENFRKLVSRNCLSVQYLVSSPSGNFFSLLYSCGSEGAAYTAVLRGHFRAGQIDTKLINTVP